MSARCRDANSVCVGEAVRAPEIKVRLAIEEIVGSGHVMALGSSGSGKTRFVASVALELIRRFATAPESVGIAVVDIADERSRMSEIAFGRTRNRSLLGTMNDFSFMAQHGNRNRDEPESPEELVRFLAQTPILPLEGASPIALTCAAFGLRSSR